MRCNECDKFVSFDTETDPECELEATRSEGPDGKINYVGLSGSIRVVNTCQECSTELAEYTYGIDMDITNEFDLTKVEDEDPEVDDTDLVRFDELKRTDRRGKPIRNSRYMKHIYGVEGTVTVSLGDKKVYVKVRDECQGSDFEDIQ